MKTAFYMEDGLVQLVLTPETRYERNILHVLHDKGHSIEVCSGKFHEHYDGYKYRSWIDNDERDAFDSTFLLLRPKPQDEPRTSSGPETPQ